MLARIFLKRHSWTYPNRLQLRYLMPSCDILDFQSRFANRWKTQYANLLLRDDVRTLESVKDIDKLEVLFEQLGRTVGSVLSLNALREDLEVAFETVRNWGTILDRLYATFRVAPYGPPRIRSVRKEQKLYFWDWTRPESSSGQWKMLLRSNCCDWPTG
jgi:predicted AAA+ superfamily ATPase